MSNMVFSGIQPTGLVHIGNYLGAIKQWIKLQNEYDSLFCIVDYHAITIPYNPTELQNNIFEAVITNIAAGLDPDKATIFVQSHVPEHTELEWLLNTITPMGRLYRMTQFKDKSRRLQEEVNAGLFNYPILQAADILLYKADRVPIGEDQLQHLELTRDIARKFNSTFGDTFPEPKSILSTAPRVMALSDPTRKMSKSIPDSFIALTDSPESIKKNVMRAVTDSGPQPDGKMSPGTANLFMLLREFAPHNVYQQLFESYNDGSLRYSELKSMLTEEIVRVLEPIRLKRDELASKPDYIHEILYQGAERAQSIAKETMAEVKSKMGLL